jgi:hypothetical protein
MPNRWKPAAQPNQMREAQRYHDWKNLPKQSKQSAILYPSLVPKETQVAMNELTEAGKRSPRASPLLSDQQRSYVSQLGGQAVRRK